MKSRFPGVCKGCGQPYERDAEIHWSKQDGGWHPRCWFERPRHIGPDAVELAERLGFVAHADAVHVLWSTVRPLPGVSGVHATRGAGAPSGEQSSLFGMPEDFESAIMTSNRKGNLDEAE
jgi:hypothetical protein